MFAERSCQEKGSNRLGWDCNSWRRCAIARNDCKYFCPTTDELSIETLVGSEALLIHIRRKILI
ncbi:hypothetical protein GTQ43_27530 [Nostoc sp. KVJ3]|uniref:hypothetical protein n=1 Tax=Nostoc sp. KVJ3 TaxID=457945 RepID=UPI002237B22F|nr:hypothetical protein [Nostoc sp. KVJ3]MCW5317423.1 hypothetical protein [Nostoc sp. KVJ3]